MNSRVRNNRRALFLWPQHDLSVDRFKLVIAHTRRLIAVADEVDTRRRDRFQPRFGVDQLSLIQPLANESAACVRPPVNTREAQLSRVDSYGRQPRQAAGYSRAGWFWLESRKDSHGGGNLIQTTGRMEVGGDA